jgi:uncharacterized protein
MKEGDKMKKLNICIDIDGTITDPYYFLSLANKYFEKNITEEQVTEYYICKVYGIEESQYDEFYEKYKWELHSYQKLRDNVKEVLKNLNLQHNIYFVTAREKSLRMLTFGYLRKNDIPFDNLFLLGTHHKVKKAIDLNCDVFIEDSYENAIELSKAGFTVLLLDTNYNRLTLNDNIIRVSNWIEIFFEVKKLLLQKKAM